MKYVGHFSKVKQTGLYLEKLSEHVLLPFGHLFLRLSFLLHVEQSLLLRHCGLLALSSFLRHGYALSVKMPKCQVSMLKLPVNDVCVGYQI